MSVFLLIVFIATSYLIVIIGGIALEMTGMERSKARFQALSAFSGTGFTTREAELVVNHPRRRKIIRYLMILGNAGIVSVIATFILSLNKVGIVRPSLNLIIIAASLYVLYRVASHHEFAQNLTVKIKEILREKLHFDKIHIEEILMQTDGYGIASILIGTDSKVKDTTIGNAGLKENDLIALSIERDTEVISLPKEDTVLNVGDLLICYGKLENIKSVFA
jgi:hypothetical protein